METVMTSLTLVDCEPVRAALAGTRIARRSWSDVKDLTQLLLDATNLLQVAKQEAQSLRDQACEEGYAAGMAQARAESVRHVLEAQQAARDLADASEERIVALAVAIVGRIAPRLGEPAVVSALAAEALSTLRAERHVRVYVSVQSLEAVRAMLEQWHRSRPDIETVQVSINPEQEPFGCVVESELGRIEAGLSGQLASLNEALTAIAAESRS
jgi:flagellar biosynthesis/type III secretory pathway protein FliH